MNYSKLLYILCFIIVIVRGVPQNLTPPTAPVQSTKTTPENNDSFVIDNNTDVSSLVANGVLYLIKNNLCTSLVGDLNTTCNKISDSLITGISEKLIDVIRSNVNTSSGNGITVSCSAIQSQISNKLISITKDTVTRELTKIGNTNMESAKQMADNVLTVIINTIEKLLCKSKNDSGNAVYKSVKRLARRIMNGVKNIDGGAKRSFKLNGEPETDPHNINIANSFSDIQSIIKNSNNNSQPQQQQQQQPSAQRIVKTPKSSLYL